MFRQLLGGFGGKQPYRKPLSNIKQMSFEVCLLAEYVGYLWCICGGSDHIRGYFWEVLGGYLEVFSGGC